MTGLPPPWARRLLAASFVVVVVTAVGSYAYFQVDEYFQILQFTNYRLGLVGPNRMPWEFGMEMRSFFQPMLYEALARALGLRDVFAIALAARLATGALAFTAQALFLDATLPWFDAGDEQRLHARVVTLAGFLPYLFVRTSSETLAMAAFTAAFAILLRGARADRGRWSVNAPVGRWLGAGLLLGVAFEARYQSAFLVLAFVGWLALVARVGVARLPALGPGFVAAVLAALACDRVGYGHLAFPAWTYFRTNLLEGAASLFGADPPFAYLWLSPANLFSPVVAALLLLALLAWTRLPRHPLTWATMPFVFVHCLLAHKEERFLFPVALPATGLVALAVAPSVAGGAASAAAGGARGRATARAAAFLWARRDGFTARLLAGWSTAVMLFLAVWPVGWNHHVRFQRWVHDELGGELHAFALPEYELGTPAFHGVYDVDKEPVDVIAARAAERGWLVADTPRLRTGDPSFDARLELVWSELPCFRHPACGGLLYAAAEAYDARARPPLRVLTFRSLYRIREAQGTN